MAGKNSSAESGNVVQFPDLKKSDRSTLLGSEIGTQFDFGQRLFAYYGSGDVFDYGEWGAREMKSMFKRDGQCSALELVLTLPIREADYMIQPARGDRGEAEFVNSVLLTPDIDGGMKTPFQELVGQITSGQIFRRAFFEKVWKIRDTDGKVIYDKIAFRPPATCQARYDQRTAARHGFRQQVWMFGGDLKVQRNQKVPGYVDIPEIRSYIYTHMKHREPLIGASEMDISYWALAYNSEVKTPDGTVRIQDIQTGDYVFGANGSPTKVLSVHPRGKRQMYRVTFADKTSVECDAEHLWEVDGRPGKSVTQPRRMVVTTQDMLTTGLRIGHHYRFAVPLCGEVQYPERALPIDPYVLGAWIGDGSIGRHLHDGPGQRTGTPFMSCTDPDSFIISEMRSRLPEEWELRRSGGNQDGSCANYHIVDTIRWHQNSYKDALVMLGLNKTSHEKFIPEIYLTASPKQRWDLLRGLMDTDGGSDIRRARSDRSLFGTVSRHLADDITSLVQSLGGKAIINDRQVARGGVYRVEIRTPRNPFLLPRKAMMWEGGETRRSFMKSVVAIEPTTEQECTCITVEAKDGLFLTNGYTVTHNCFQTKMKLLLQPLLVVLLPRKPGHAAHRGLWQRPARSQHPRR